LGCGFGLGIALVGEEQGRVFAAAGGASKCRGADRRNTSAEPAGSPGRRGDPVALSASLGELGGMGCGGRRKRPSGRYPP
jgi:hypothetical protein